MSKDAPIFKSLEEMKLQICFRNAFHRSDDTTESSDLSFQLLHLVIDEEGFLICFSFHPVSVSRQSCSSARHLPFSCCCALDCSGTNHSNHGRDSSDRIAWTSGMASGDPSGWGDHCRSSFVFLFLLAVVKSLLSAQCHSVTQGFGFHANLRRRNHGVPDSLCRSS
jgi:hypothetical protein